MVDDTAAFQIKNLLDAYFNILYLKIRALGGTTLKNVVRDGITEIDYTPVEFLIVVHNTGEVAATKALTLKDEAMVVLETMDIFLEPDGSTEVTLDNAAEGYAIPDGTIVGFTLETG